MRYFLSICILLLLTPLNSQITAILPESNDDLIHQEGENAVVTNYNTTPTLDYSASGKRLLQLNTYKGNYNNNPYFSKYIIYVPESGSYDIWYSGTPPGTKEDIFPSYSSPFTLLVDNSEYELYRENVNVVESYAPGLYWIKTINLELEKGFHEIEFRVTEKRKFDGKYYFYLDSFFLFKGDETSPGLIPEVFPENMLDRSIDNAFRDISTYQANIRNNPEVSGNYLSLAHIYILIGDYLNAIKMLTRVLQLDPDNKTAKLLMAKSRIWNGNIDQGIRAYRDYLEVYPESLSIWEEAAKVTAWLGRLDTSLELFGLGLQVYPGNSSLLVNKAFTHLWNGEIDEGLTILQDVENSLDNNASSISHLASIYSVNGYKNYAIDLYEKSIKQYPDLIELYLNLETLFRETGELEKADEILNNLTSNFSISEQLQQILDTNSKKSIVKDQFISSLEAKLLLDPENLSLRELLVQTLFWNGLVNRAIDEYIAILVVYNYQDLKLFDDKSHDLYFYYDILHYIEDKFNNRIEELTELKKEFYNDVILYRTALLNNSDIDDAKGILESTINSVNEIYNRNRYYYELFNTLEDEIINITGLEEEQQDVFNKLIGNRWTLNRKLLINELNSSLENDSVKEFSSYILSMYYLINSEFTQAEGVIDNLDEFTSRNKLVRYHNKLWSGESFEQDLTELHIYYPHISRELEIISGYNNVITTPEVIDSNYIDNIQTFLQEVDLEQRQIHTFIKIIRSYKESTRVLLENSLIRTFFRNQENTNLIRYTIGDYYLQNEQYNDALIQFKQVNSVDPFNVSAQFKLGRLQQLTGDWKGALTSYEDVFNTDPSYENASTMHNQLSLQHPELSSVTVDYFSDPNMIEFSENFTTQFNITSWFRMDPEWSISTISLLEWPRKRYRVDSIAVKSTLSLLNNQFSLSPKLGVLLYNTTFDNASPFDEVTYSTVLESSSYYSDLAVDLNLQIDAYTLSLSLGQSTLKESIPDDIDTLEYIENSYSISGYYPIPQYRNWNNLAFRSYFHYKTLYGFDHSNTIFTYAQDITSNIQILRDPWTTLTLYNSTTYENSLTQDNDIYYTPDSVFVSKLGGTIASYIGVNSGVLGLIGRIGGGIYVEEMFGGNLFSFASDGDIQVNYTKNNRTLFFKAYGSLAMDDFDIPDYWALQFSIGFNLSISKLLTH